MNAPPAADAPAGPRTPGTFRFVHAADLHLDSPLRGLQAFDAAPVQRLRGATRAAFVALVDLALTHDVQFVLLAGDIFDGDWRDFSTGLFYREQLVRLDAAGIAVFVVHGNHDAASQITRRLPAVASVHVFGSDAASTVRIDALGVAVHGRSFGNRAVVEDLVPGYPQAVAGCFNIGILHTSLAGSPEHDTYAPTTEAALAATGYDYLALGHVHARRVVRAHAPRIVFPGNTQGRHARETGPKGCELVTVRDGRIESAEFVALDVVRWHRIAIDASGADDDTLHVAIRDALAALVHDDPQRLHAVRLVVSGASVVATAEAASPGHVAAIAHAAAQDCGSPQLWVESVELRLAPPFDRDAALARDDAVAELLRVADGLRTLVATDGREAAAQLLKLAGGTVPTLPAELAGTLPARFDAARLLRWIDEAEQSVIALLSAQAATAARAAQAPPAATATRAGSGGKASRGAASGGPDA